MFRKSRSTFPEHALSYSGFNSIGFYADGRSQTSRLHLVFGGELVDLEGTEFRDLDTIDIVGLFPDYQSAYKAWKARAQATVDNAHMRYFVAHLHRLLEPTEPPKS